LALIALIVAATGMALFVLPVWSFIRIARLSREVAELRARLDTLSGTRAAVVPPPVRPPDPTAEAAAAASTPAPSQAAPPPGPDAALRPAAPPFEPGPAAPGGAPVADTAPPADLEAWVGGRWLLYAGVAILLIGISFFLKYAFENAWVDERGRVVLGAGAGLGLVVAGARVERRLKAFGRALCGAGIATLYLASYAAFGFYALVGPGPAFASMAATTALAVWLADRRAAESLALVAAIGGYATPFLVANGNPTATVLFGYVLLLGVGVLALTGRHRWLGLPVAAHLLTVAALGGWAVAYYDGSQWLRVLLWLTALLSVFVAVLARVRRQEGARARVAAVVLWSAPVLYHVAAVALTLRHPPAIHVYLILFTAATLLLTAVQPGGWVRLAVLVAAYAGLFAYLAVPQGGSWLVPNLVTAVAVAGMHLLTTVDRVTRQERALGTFDLVAMHVTVIGLQGLLAEMLRPRFGDWPGGAAAGLAILAAGLWRVFERRDPVAALNAAGLSFTLVAIALAERFDGRVVVIGWAAEGAVAAWFGVRASNLPFKAGGLLLFALAALRLAGGYLPNDPSAAVVFNDRTAATAVVVTLAYLLAWHWRRHSTAGSGVGVVSGACHVLASLFTLLWMSAEIEAYWRADTRDVQARLSEELTRSLAWGLYGSALVAAGMWRGLVSLRWIGIIVIGLTVLKVFVVDLSQLGGIYRVVGFVALGAILLGVSYLYQRARGRDGRASVSTTSG